MANENNDISDIVKKCKILLLDIEGTTTSISFVKDKLFPYAEANAKEFLESQWESEDVKGAVSALRKQAVEDEETKVEGVVTIPGEDAAKDDQIAGLVKNVKWQMSVDRKAGPLKQLQGLIWKKGYESGEIKGHVYDDVSPAIQQWVSTLDQKVYIYSSGSVQAQKLLFGQSLAGDLTPYIAGYFDTSVGGKQEPASYKAIVESVGCEPGHVLFLSDVHKECEAALSSGVHAALVVRDGAATGAGTGYPVIRSFEQLTVTNKRKTDSQAEELPAKVAKTDIEADVKSATEAAVEATSAQRASVEAPKIVTTEENAPKNDVAEKMDVEDDTPDVEKEKVEEKEPIVETTVDDTDKAIDAATDVEAIVKESVDKTEKNETEQMETDAEVKETSANEPKESDNSPAIEENRQEITVEDVTNELQNLPEAEIIEGLEPIVEEPTVDMEDLESAGNELEKECDEILSKVQDVTNLDNIPIKPLLNCIPEESIDAENGENTNDIVESILDSEMEVQARSSEKINVNTEEAKLNNEEGSVAKADDKQTEQTIENVVQEKAEVSENVEVEKSKENNPLEEKNAIETRPEVTNGEPESRLEPVQETKEIVEETPKKDVKDDIAPEDSKMEAEESNTQADNKVETNGTMETDEKQNGVNTEENIAIVAENKETEKPAETTEMQSSTQEVKTNVNVALADTEMQTEDSCPTEKQTEATNNTELASNQVTNTEDKPITKTVEVMESDDAKTNANEKVIQDNKMDDKATLEHKMDAEVTKADNKNEKVTLEDNKTDVEVPLEIKMDAEVLKEDHKNERIPENNKMDTEVTESTNETQPKPDTTDSNVQTEDKKLNGDSKELNGVSKDTEINERLSVENGEKGENGENGKNCAEINGANGNSDEKAVKVSEIKVKTVEETRPEPVEPTQA